MIATYESPFEIELALRLDTLLGFPTTPYNPAVESIRLLKCPMEVYPNIYARLTDTGAPASAIAFFRQAMHAWAWYPWHYG